MPNTEGDTCNCATGAEHLLLEVSIDASYKKDIERAKERQKRNTRFLRAEIVRQLNGDPAWDIQDALWEGYKRGSS